MNQRLLSPYDYDVLEGFVKKATKDVTDEGGVAVMAASRNVIHLLDKADSEGVDGAHRVLLQLAANGARDLVRAEFKAREIAITLPGRDTPVMVKEFISVRRRRPTGSSAHQLVMFWHVSPQELLAFVDQMQRHRDRVSQELSVYGAIARIVKDHQDKATVLDALKAAGADPAEYGYEESA